VLVRACRFVMSDHTNLSRRVAALRLQRAAAAAAGGGSSWLAGARWFHLSTGIVSRPRRAHVLEAAWERASILGR
jgi:hypothetical protein